MRRWILPAVTALALSACQKSDPPPKGAAGPKVAPASQGVAGAAPAARSDLLARAVAFAKVPPQAAMLAVARGPKALLDLVGYAKARAAVGEPWAKLAAEAVREVGFDATDPLAIGKTFGLDPEHPIGLVLLNLSELRVGIFARVADPKAFEAGLKVLFDHGPRPLPKAQQGGATTWVDPRGELAFLLQGDRVWLIIQDRRRTYGLHAAIRQITETKGGGLADTEDFKQAAADLTLGRDLAGYVNVNAVVGAIVAEVTGSARVQRLRDEVAHLEATGEDAERLERVKARLARREGKALSRAAQGAAITMAIQTFAGGLSAVQGGVNLGDGALDLALGLRASDSSLPHRILDPGKGPGWQALGAAKTPMFAATAQVDVKGIDGLIRQAATFAGGGRDIQRFEEEIRRELGLDLQKDIVDLLDGRAEFILRSEHPKALKSTRDFEAAFKGGLAIGVKDEAKAKSVVERVLARSPKPESARADAQGRYTLALDPQFTLTLQVANGWLILSNEGGAPSKPGIAGLSPAVQQVLGADLSGRQLVDWPQMADLALRQDEAWRAEWYKGEPDARRAARETHRKNEAQIARRIFALFGPVAAALRLADGKLTLRVRQITQGSAAEVLTGLAKGVAEVEAENRRYWNRDRETELKRPDGVGLAEPMPAVKDETKMDLGGPVEKKDLPKMPPEPVEKR